MLARSGLEKDEQREGVVLSMDYKPIVAAVSLIPLFAAVALIPIFATDYKAAWLPPLSIDLN